MTIESLKAELYDLSRKHGAHLAHAQQHQQAAGQIERVIVARQARLDELEAEAAKEKEKPAE